jgi:hypothetical protein
VQWIARARDHAVRVESFLAITTRAEPLRAALLARCDLLLQVAGDK